MTAVITQDQARLLADLVAAFRTDWDRAGVLAQSHLAARGGIDGMQHAISMLIAASKPKNTTPSSVNFAASQQRDIDSCGKPEHEHCGYRAGYGCAGCYAEQAGSDVPLPVQPKSARSDEDRARIRELARGSKP